jgi:hypothetical protein
MTLNSPERAILALEKALRYDQGNITARLELSKVLASCGKIHEALAQIHEIFRVVPSIENCVETTRSILEWAPDTISLTRFVNDATEVPVVTMSLLGNDGRFGNQIYQYAFLKMYSNYHGFEYEAPPWIGQALFGHNDPPLKRILPLRMCTEGGLVPFQQSVGYDCIDPPCNVDLQGYFQHHTSVYSPFKAQFRSYFNPVPEVADQLHKWVAECRRDCTTLIVLHLRFGDQTGTEYESNPASCISWLRSSWTSWVRPRLIVISDDIVKASSAFNEFSPYSPPKITLPIEGADFYPDYFLMTQADVLVVSRSTFSFTASLLNERTDSFYRPTDDRSKIIPFDPWNSYN